MNFSNLSDEQLEAELLLAVSDETKALMRVLHLLAEAERRRLYSKDYPNLFEYCVKVLKYPGGSAQRRIDTMRAMKLIPEIEKKIVSGDLNLSLVSEAQKFFRHEAKNKKPYSVKEKKELLTKLENKSVRECVQTLVAISPESVSQEKRRVLTAEKTEMKVILDNDLIEKLDRIKSLLSHKNANMTDKDLLIEMADFMIRHIDPAQQKSRQKSPTLQKVESKPSQNVSQNSPSIQNPSQKTAQAETIPPKPLPTSAAKFRGHIPVVLRREVWRRDGGRCTKSGCNSRHFLQVDHVIPVALGGKTEFENLRLLCRSHNQRAAIDVFGFKKMNQYINGQTSY